jgi:WD40 repeat protein
MGAIIGLNGYDGTLFCTWNGAHEVQLWKIPECIPIHGPFALNGSVQKVCFSDDNRFLLTLCDNSTQVWDIKSLDPISSPLIQDSIIEFFAFSPDSLSFLTRSSGPAFDANHLRSRSSL